METVKHGAMTLYDFEPTVENVAEVVLSGLLQPAKSLPCKLLYDERGSQIFEEICTLDEYYPTRTELGILSRNASEVASLVGPRSRIVEPGSGNSLKTRLLLESLAEPAVYVPIDISRVQLVDAATMLTARFPSLTVAPVCADYTQDFDLPAPPAHSERTVIYFPGSTIGNFEPKEAEEFLRRMANWSGSGGGLLIGVDLKKDAAILNAAYNDRQGVTAAFNLNLLKRINRELDADFQTSGFRHLAVYDDTRGCIEMRLISLLPQTAHVLGHSIRFDEGEAIVTEHSYKYDQSGFEQLATRAGYATTRIWIDDNRLFSIWFLTVLD